MQHLLDKCLLNINLLRELSEIMCENEAVVVPVEVFRDGRYHIHYLGNEVLLCVAGGLEHNLSRMTSLSVIVNIKYKTQ